LPTYWGIPWWLVLRDDGSLWMLVILSNLYWLRRLSFIGEKETTRLIVRLGFLLAVLVSASLLLAAYHTAALNPLVAVLAALSFFAFAQAAISFHAAVSQRNIGRSTIDRLASIAIVVASGLVAGIVSLSDPETSLVFSLGAVSIAHLLIHFERRLLDESSQRSERPILRSASSLGLSLSAGLIVMWLADLTSSVQFYSGWDEISILWIVVSSALLAATVADIVLTEFSRFMFRLRLWDRFGFRALCCTAAAIAAGKIAFQEEFHITEAARLIAATVFTSTSLTLLVLRPIAHSARYYYSMSYALRGTVFLCVSTAIIALSLVIAPPRFEAIFWRGIPYAAVIIRTVDKSSRRDGDRVLLIASSAPDHVTTNGIANLRVWLARSFSNVEYAHFAADMTRQPFAPGTFTIESPPSGDGAGTSFPFTHDAEATLDSRDTKWLTPRIVAPGFSVIPVFDQPARANHPLRWEWQLTPKADGPDEVDVYLVASGADSTYGITALRAPSAVIVTHISRAISKPYTVSLGSITTVLGALSGAVSLGTLVISFYRRSKTQTIVRR
jgi:hypothetical protein